MDCVLCSSGIYRRIGPLSTLGDHPFNYVYVQLLRFFKWDTRVRFWTCPCGYMPTLTFSLADVSHVTVDSRFGGACHNPSRLLADLIRGVKSSSAPKSDRSVTLSWETQTPQASYWSEAVPSRLYGSHYLDDSFPFLEKNSKHRDRGLFFLRREL